MNGLGLTAGDRSITLAAQRPSKRPYAVHSVTDIRPLQVDEATLLNWSFMDD